MTLEHRVKRLEQQNRFFIAALLGLLLVGLSLGFLFIAHTRGESCDEDGLVCPLDQRAVRDALIKFDRGCTAAERYLYSAGIDLEYYGIQSMREDLQGPGEKERGASHAR